MAKVTLASGFEFEAERDISILDSAERHGARLEYSCRTGRCSTCKARVSSGATTALHAETGLDPDEAGAGWILTCVRSAGTDVTFSQDNQIEFDLPRPSLQPLRINTIERVTDALMIVRFRLAPSSRWTYLPGQHAEIIGPEGVRRVYSMANAPSLDRVVELHVKRYPGGALSDYWFDHAVPDDLLRLHGPLGTFVLRESERPVVFLATGTGIAPVKAIVEQLLAEGSTRPVRVYHGARRAEDLHWSPADWLAHHAFVPVLSMPDESWAGRVGYVQHALLDDLPDLSGVDLYACGSDAMIHDARRVSMSAGLDRRRFFSDAFVESAPMEDGE